MSNRLETLQALGGDRLVSVHRQAGRTATYAAWPSWVDNEVVNAFRASGITRLWKHQVDGATDIHQGRPTIIATGTGSGKSAAAWLDYLNRFATHDESAHSLREVLTIPTAIYIAPTKALARSQAAALHTWAHPLGLQIGIADGDSTREQKMWTRTQAHIVVTNPDYLHYAMLPNAKLWTHTLSHLQLIVVDELHYYRGVMGAHLSLIIKRLLRLTRTNPIAPNVCCLSATTANPKQAMGRLIGVDSSQIAAVTDDTCARAEHTTVLWRPKIIMPRDDDQPEPPDTSDDVSTHPQRRHPITEAGEVVGQLIATGARVLAFVSSRAGAESLAQAITDYVSWRNPQLMDKVAAYRGGYLPEERRELERQLSDGQLLAVASTSALELGIDISGLDVTVTVGWPGSRASFRQQSGRAGRAGREGMSVFIAGENPLDAYMVNNPDAIFGQVEPTIFDPDNPYVAAGHILCAAAEAPLTDDDIDLFGPNFAPLVHQHVIDGLLRQRPRGIFFNPASGVDPHGSVDIRSAGQQVTIVHRDTGQVIGTVDSARADAQAHPGAIYVHQGRLYYVHERTDQFAVVSDTSNQFRTAARATKHVTIMHTDQSVAYDGYTWHRGMVSVSSQVTSYGLYRMPQRENMGEFPIDAPQRTLTTQATWLTLSPQFLADHGVDDVASSIHAVEHAAIGLLPAMVTCDRWDIGGLSVDIHADTQLPTIFIYDGYAGGAGFSHHGFNHREQWLRAVWQTVGSCPCTDGCPACIQSPKCGNNNEYLSKAGAIRLLEALVTQLE